MSPDAIPIRAGTNSDIGYILDTWRDSVRDAKPMAPLYRWRPEAARHIVGHLIRGILNRQDAIVSVACDPVDPDTILGYTVSSGSTLHFAYVRGGSKASFRGLGLVPRMLRRVPQHLDSYSFVTEHAHKRLKVDERGWTHSPEPFIPAWLQSELPVWFRAVVDWRPAA